MQHAANADSDVLPPPVNRILALLWILLLGGRWIVVTWLLAAGALKRDQVAGWDEGVLLRCYLILLAVTLVVVALRTVRAARPTVPATSPPQAGTSPPDTQAGATAAGDAASRRSSPTGAAGRRVQGRD